MTGPARRRQSGSGFTLLEMMIAIAILGLVLVMVAGSFNAVAHSKVHGEERLDLDRDGRAIVWQIGNELRGAVQTPMAVSQVVLIGVGQTRDGLPMDALTVSTFSGGHHRSITGFGAEELVIYSVTPNPNHRGWYILTRTQSSALAGGNPNAPAVVLASDVVSLHIRYMDPVGFWHESWDSTAQQRLAQLPVAASIDLALGADRGAVSTFSTAVTLPMAVTVW